MSHRLLTGLFLAGLLSTIPATATAATFFVAPGGSDSNSGTSTGQAWATLQNAADIVTAGDTVNVLAGTYAGFDLRTSGALNNPITFLAEPGAVINQVNGVTNDGINIENASHIVIDGFTLASPNSSSRAGIRVVGDGFTTGVFSEFVTLRNNTLTNWGKWGIFTGFADDLLIENNSTSGAVLEHGIYVSNSGDRPTIRNNLIFNNNANGIHMNGDIDTGNTSLPNVDGIISGAIVEGNIIFGNGAGGGSGINGDGAVGVRIVNNLLYENHASGISLYQIDGGAPSTGSEIVNNTIINAGNARWVINLRDGATGATVFNNILFNLNGSNFRGAIAALEGSEFGLVSDFNLLDPRFSLEDDSAFINLAAWQSATGNDENSLPLTLAQMQALFADYAQQDFTLADTSAARDFGVASLLNGSLITAPDGDLLGLARPSGAGFDAGAYEFQVVPEPSAARMGLVGVLLVGGLIVTRSLRERILRAKRRLR